MRNSFALRDLEADMELIATYDHDEIDNRDPLAFSRLRYLDRINLIIDCARRFAPPSAMIADLGCAQGNVSLLLAEAGFHVTAVDLNSTFLRYSRLKYERGLVEWRLGNIESPGLPLASQEFVILAEVVEHCAYPERIVEKAFELLVPSGHLLITTPNRNLLGAQRLPSFREILCRNSRSELEAKQFGPAGEDHLFLFTHRELKVLCPPGGSIVASGYLSNTIIGKIPRALLALLFDPSLSSRVMRFLSLVPLVNILTSAGLYLLLRKEKKHCGRKILF